MSDTVYQVNNTNFDRGAGDNPVNYISTPKGNLPMEGIIVPYSNIVSPTVTIVSNGSTTFNMSQLTSTIPISLPNDGDPIASPSSFGGIVDAFNQVSNNIGSLAPAIVTTATITDSNFNFVNQPVIFFSGITQYYTITYPTYWSPIPDFINLYHYIWYYKRDCYPISYSISLMRFDKIPCI